MKSKMFSLRIDSVDDAIFAELSAKTGLNKSDAIRAAALIYLTTLARRQEALTTKKVRDESAKK